MNDIVNFDFTLNINQNEINESFRGILLVYNTKDELLGYIATYDGSYTLQTSFEFVTQYDDYGNIEYDNIASLLTDNQITKGYIKLLKDRDENILFLEELCLFSINHEMIIYMTQKEFDKILEYLNKGEK